LQTYALLASLPKYLIVYARRSGTSDLNRTVLGPVDVEQLNAMKMSALDKASCELHPAASLHRRKELPNSLSGTGSEPVARRSHCCPNFCVSFARPQSLNCAELA
jgi:GR25 family glycosyltransferase involved in LPS biosynthesis